MTRCGIICTLCLERILRQRTGALPVVKEEPDAQTADNVNYVKSKELNKTENPPAADETDNARKSLDNQICEKDNDPKLNKIITPSCEGNEVCQSEGLHGRGLLYYKKWWEKNVVDIFISGSCITGTPIFINKNTLRVVNDTYSYFVPLEKIDFIRTNDGLKFTD